VEYPLYQPRNGWAEQDPEDWWDAVVQGIRAVLARSGIKPENIKGIGLSGQMHGLVMLDNEGKVLRRSIIWCDQRTAKECQEITARIGYDRLVEITANPALTGFTASKIMWVMNNEPHIYEKCAHILLPKDYIRFKLTGEFATEVSDASGMQLLDVPNRQWSDYVLQKLGIDKAMLGKVYESPEITGVINSSVADLTGLKEGTLVVGGAGDNAAAAVGTGVVRDGRAFTTIGTSGVVYAHTSKVAIDIKGRVHTFCSAVPGQWHIMGVTQGAGLSLRWFRDHFCKSEMEEAKLMGIDPYDLILKEVEAVPIGANKLIYLPYLMGERTPHLDPNARGVFFGLSAIHTKQDMLRAIMEGVSYSLKDCLGIFNDMGITVDSMMAAGGGGASTMWRQMLADLYACPVKTAMSKEGPALGVALLAGVGAGIYNSVAEACDIVIKPDIIQQPIRQNTDNYNQYYEIYQKIYPALKQNFEDLQQL
jgi:xylulokinase